MGWYGSTDGGANNGGRNRTNRNANATRSRSNANYLPNPRIEKVLEGQTTGKGIKCTPAYEWKVTQDELKKWRKEFWDTRIQGNRDVWSILKNAIEAEPEDAEAIIKASGLTAHAGIMTLVFDAEKFPYRIPIACINDPISYADAVYDENDAPDEEDYELKIRGIGVEDFEVEISNLSLVSELKVKYLDHVGQSDLSLENWIFLFYGRKIDDNLPLYRVRGLDSGVVVQCMLVQ